MIELEINIYKNVEKFMQLIEYVQIPFDDIYNKTSEKIESHKSNIISLSSTDKIP